MKKRFNVSFSLEVEFDESHISESEAIGEITNSMHFPCEDTENVSIISQSVVEREDAKKPFVRLTIVGQRKNANFKKSTGLNPNHVFGDAHDYEDIDLSDCLPKVVRAVGRMNRQEYYFTTEESR